MGCALSAQSRHAVSQALRCLRQTASSPRPGRPSMRPATRGLLSSDPSANPNVALPQARHRSRQPGGRDGAPTVARGRIRSRSVSAFALPLSEYPSSGLGGPSVLYLAEHNRWPPPHRSRPFFFAGHCRRMFLAVSARCSEHLGAARDPHGRGSVSQRVSSGPRFRRRWGVGGPRCGFLLESSCVCSVVGPFSAGRDLSRCACESSLCRPRW
jgi:hypothetical protein